MVKLNLNEALLICHGSRNVTVEWRDARGEWAKSFPSMLSAIEWGKSKGFKFI